MPKRMTAASIAAAKRHAVASATRVTVTDAGCAGLQYRASPGGEGAYSLLLRVDGIPKRFHIGPDTALGVAEARAAAHALRAEVMKGADPTAERKTRRVQAADARVGVNTFEAVLDRYAQVKGRKLKSWPKARRSICYVFAQHLNLPAARLSRLALQDTVDDHAAQHHASCATRALKVVFRWSARRGMVAADLIDLVPPAAVQRRDRVLDRAELARLLPVLEASTHPSARAMRLMLWSACRREEAGQAKWRDVDLATGLWTVPVTKTGRPHLVPLPRQARAMLAAMGPGKPDAFIFATSASTPERNWNRIGTIIQKASGTSGWHRHDLRRTAATLMGEMGIEPFIIEACLNHVIHSTIASIYNRSKYLPQRAVALQQLADALDDIAAGTSDVVLLNAGAAA